MVEELPVVTFDDLDTPACGVSFIWTELQRARSFGQAIAAFVVINVVVDGAFWVAEEVPEDVVGEERDEGFVLWREAAEDKILVVFAGHCGGETVNVEECVYFLWSEEPVLSDCQ